MSSDGNEQAQAPETGKRFTPDQGALVSEKNLISMSGPLTIFQFAIRRRMSPLSKVQLKWMEAARDLQLSIGIDFDLVLKPDIFLKAPVFLRDFGGEKGTLILESSDDISALEKELRRAGFGYSVQKSHDSDKYDREIFIEMLAEWGWTGKPDCIPVWYPEEF